MYKAEFNDNSMSAKKANSSVLDCSDRSNNSETNDISMLAEATSSILSNNQEHDTLLITNLAMHGLCKLNL